jgi:hypothetical protein
MRTQLAVSMIRATMLIKHIQKVMNSALANGCGLGTASRSLSGACRLGDGQPRVGPVAAHAADLSAQLGDNLLARWRGVSSQQHRDRARGDGVVDMDQRKAALIMRVEHLLGPCTTSTVPSMSTMTARGVRR